MCGCMRCSPDSSFVLEGQGRRHVARRSSAAVSMCMLEHFGFRDMERPKKVSEHQNRCLLMLKTLVGRLMQALVGFTHMDGLTCSELAQYRRSTA
jgi:hypothetical protein